MEKNVVADKLRRHAANVRLAGHFCEPQIDALMQVEETDDAMRKSKDELLAKEQMKQSVLYQAAEFMEALADRLSEDS